VMYVPYLILAVATVGIGLTGPLFEAQLHAFFEPMLGSHTLGAQSYLVAAASEEGGWLSGEVAALSASAVALILGGLPGYYLYVVRRVDPIRLVQGNGVLNSLQQFLVKRWYINTIYYRVFVRGLLLLTTRLFRSTEVGGFDRFNYVFGASFLKLARGFRRTHTGELRYNMLAFELGMLFIVFLLIFTTYLPRL